MAEKAVEAIIGKSRRKKSATDRARRDRSDLVKQLLEVYRRGTSYEEFWELVDRLRTFRELRKNFSA